MKRRISAGALAFIICLSLVQPAAGAVIDAHSANLQQIESWEWAGNTENLPKPNETTGQQEHLISTEDGTLSRDALAGLLPTQILAVLAEEGQGEELTPPSSEPPTESTQPEGTEPPAEPAQQPEGSEPPAEPAEQPEGSEPAAEPAQPLPLALEWNLENFPETGGTPGNTYDVSAALPEGFVLKDGTDKITVTIQLSTALEQALRQNEIKETVSPVGTIINAFDYWVAADGEEGRGMDDWAPCESDGSFNRGINAGHFLKFGKLTGADSPYGSINCWTCSAAPRPGITERILGPDGYPVLSGGLPTDFWPATPELLPENLWLICLTPITDISAKRHFPA